MAMADGRPMDLSTVLIVKARLGDDIRKVPIQNFDISRDELLVMMERIFDGKISPSDKVLIKYMDEDEDLITINDDSDLNFAISCHRVLKLTLHGSLPKECRNSDDGLVPEAVRSTLVRLRDRTNKLLDQFKFAHSYDQLVVDEQHPEGREEVREEEPRRTASSTADRVNREDELTAPVNTVRSAGSSDQQVVESSGSESNRYSPPTPSPSIHGIENQGQEEIVNTEHNNNVVVEDVGQGLNELNGGGVGGSDNNNFSKGSENVASIQPTVHQMVYPLLPSPSQNTTPVAPPPAPTISNHSSAVPQHQQFNNQHYQSFSPLPTSPLPALVVSDPVVHMQHPPPSHPQPPIMNNSISCTLQGQFGRQQHQQQQNGEIQQQWRFSNNGSVGEAPGWPSNPQHPTSSSSTPAPPTTSTNHLQYLAVPRPVVAVHTSPLQPICQSSAGNHYPSMPPSNMGAAGVRQGMSAAPPIVGPPPPTGIPPPPPTGSASSNPFARGVSGGQYVRPTFAAYHRQQQL